VGTEQIMLLANRGDSLDTRLILRYDTLPAVYNFGADTINVVDSAFLDFTFDSLAKNVTVPVTISVYDIDSTGSEDTSASVLAARFTQARLIGSRTLDPGKAVDTVSVPVLAAVVQNRVQTGKRLRVGVQVTTSTPGQSVSLHQPAVEVTSSLGVSEGVRISIHVTHDTVRDTVAYLPSSKVVGSNFLDALALRDFMIVVRGNPAPPSGTIAIGGLPTKRAYFRFALPPNLVDSAIVIRATLLLTQVASGSPDPTDSMLVRPFVGAATSTVMDPERAGKLTSSLVVFDPLVTHPATSGVQEIQIAPAFGVWALQDSSVFPRAIILESGNEFVSPQQALFYSSDDVVPVALRPKVRITYTPRTRIGTP
jgi:hypothetical protein